MTKEFQTQFGEYVSMIEEALPAYLPVESPDYRPVTDAMRYSLMAGGKRIRGVLVLAFYHLFDGEVQRALPFAAAMEMIHAYSLIHDDLPCMDDDDMRRGKPACHIAHGEATALLAGDGLLTRAMEIACCCEGFPPERVLQATQVLARRAGVEGMIGGQTMDIANEGKSLTSTELDAINLRKTGALICAGAEIGCILGGLDRGKRVEATEYARCIGLAFQIMDDVLDVTADPEKLGKPLGSDAEKHKNTYAAVFGIQRCHERIAELNDGAKRALRRLGKARVAGTAPRDTKFLEDLADMLAAREH